MEATLVFPHQLFEDNPAIKKGRDIYLIEEWLFFHQFHFLKQKLVYHRACMKQYAAHLRKKGHKIHYIDAGGKKECDSRQVIHMLGEKGVESIHLCDVTDDWLRKRIRSAAKASGIKVNWCNSPLFLNTARQTADYQPPGSRWFHAAFYQQQRERYKLLLTEEGKPQGGKWSFDTENRKPLPARIRIPILPLKSDNRNQYLKEAKNYVEKHFKNNYGSAEVTWCNGIAGYFPTDHLTAKAWLKTFLEERLRNFGAYEDAIAPMENMLYHSGITPMLNCGLLTPDDVVQTLIEHAENHKVPIASVEGYLRQVIGWREFMRTTYEHLGRRMRTTNFFKFSKRRLPKSFYDGTTGIYPVDACIAKTLDTGYLHHIERLMVMGNFFLLCEVHPDEVYQWFMELFLDAYDWVMVPNVYGMSQFADGGSMITKPYISSSNYLMKMGRYEKGEWQDIWDALFWRFIHKHEPVFANNARMKMMATNWRKMEKEKQKELLHRAETFLKQLWN